MNKKLISIIGLIVIIVDQIIKIAITKMIPLYLSKEVVPDFFYITHVHNEGAAWSILSGNTFFLIIISLIILFVIYFFYIKNKYLNKEEIIIYGLLIGGIIGNLVDRFIYGYVIDYLEFIIFNYHYPVFNLADICIVVSIILLVIYSIREDLCKRSKLKKM